MHKAQELTCYPITLPTRSQLTTVDLTYIGCSPDPFFANPNIKRKK